MNRNNTNEELDKFKEWLETLGYAKTTIKSYNQNLKYFFKWIEKGHHKITHTNIKKYNKYLHQRNLNGSTIESMIGTIKLYDKYLQKVENRKIIKGELEIEKSIKSEREILTYDELERLYNLIEDNILGLRDRVILGLYYGCGLRRKEGINLKLNNIDYKRGLIEVVKSKTYRNRFIPLTERVKKDILNYIKYSRPYLIDREEDNKGSDGYLLIGYRNGVQMSGGSVNARFTKVIKESGIEKRISIHNLRHSIGTHLHQKGMGIEEISMFLGHKRLDATQIYTRIK